MTESLEAFRNLGLASVFEDLYFGKEVSANLQVYMSYPSEFRGATLDDWKPLTEGGLIPIVDDGNFSQICLFDPRARKFVVKFVEEPQEIVAEFDHWQQYLAYTLLEMAESGPSEDELTELSDILGFRYTVEMLSLLREMETLSESEIDEKADRFIEACGG